MSTALHEKLTEKSKNAAGATSTVEITANNLPGDESNPEKLSEKNVNTPVTGPAVSDNKTKEIGTKNTPSQDNNKLRYISKYLVQFVPDAKPQNKEATVRISGARVLTGEKCAAILKEREEKKRKEEEEKERKKLLREKKKQEKEEEQRKKKALAAEKRALAAEKKAQAAAKKAEREAKKPSQHADKPSRKRQNDAHVSTIRSKLPRVDEVSTMTDEAENVCCVCFQCYQDDQEDSDWLQCACKRWLHKDCIID